VSDYFANDEHPNAQGYAKIAACAAEVVSELASKRAEDE
jgi:hypothetical protein